MTRSPEFAAAAGLVASLLALILLPGSVLGAGASPEVQGANRWLNTPSESPPDFKGKVVLVQFWTYTCVNWRRTLPYVRAWSDKYRDQGLVVVGVHTPEFDFEEQESNVESALKEMRINYPVAIDNRHAIWDAFHNVYWPALYLIDAKGKIRYRQFGEGDYARSEREIQKLLAESGANPASDTVAVAPVGAEVPADLSNLRSPETYVGLDMGERFASKERALLDRHSEYSFPKHLGLNEWALSGSWTIRREAALLDDANGRIVYRFHARDLNLIMAPPGNGTQVRFRVLIDGEPPGNAHGLDTDEQGFGVVSGARMYQLIRQSGDSKDREATVEFNEPGVRIYDFTFG